MTNQVTRICITEYLCQKKMRKHIIICHACSFCQKQKSVKEKTHQERMMSTSLIESEMAKPLVHRTNILN